MVFHALVPEHAKRIVGLMVGDLETRVKVQGIGIQVTDAALDWLCEEGIDDTYGARP